MSGITMPQTAITLAKRFEGFERVPKNDPSRAHPYICPAGFWTIGYGHLCDKQHPPITEAEAESYLAATCKRRWPPRCATVRCWPQSRRGGWQPSWTSPSTSA